jgi:hypothetical protein
MGRLFDKIDVRGTRREDTNGFGLGFQGFMDVNGEFRLCERISNRPKNLDSVFFEEIGKEGHRILKLIGLQKKSLGSSRKSLCGQKIFWWLSIGLLNSIMDL